MRSLLLLIVLIVTGCAAEEASPEEHIGTVSEAIIDGTSDTSDDAAVALILQGQIFCSGTLISETVVLTAAHCVDPSPPDHVLFGSKLGATGAVLIAVTQTHAHDDFDDATLENDIAIVGLAEKAPVKPATVSTKELTEGAKLRLVGFGVTNSNNDDSAGKKRYGNTTVDSVTDTEFRFKANPAQTCSGDSGGPAFGTNSKGQRILVGVTSSGDSDCKVYGRDIRVDAYADFIDQSSKAYSLPLGENGQPISSGGCSMGGRASSGSWLLFALAALVTMGRRVIRSRLDQARAAAALRAFTGANPNARP